MAPLTTTTGAPVLTPQQIHELVWLPLQSQSVALRVGNVVPISAHSLRVPRVTARPQASFVAEGAELPNTDAAVDQIDVVPTKVAGISVITSELAEDSSPAALQIVGQGLVEDVAATIDEAVFANTTTNANNGLLSISPSLIDAGDSLQNLDAFESAKSVAEQHNVTIDTFVANPATVLKLSVLKEYGTAGSNRALLQPDPTAPAVRTIAGVPLVSSPAVAATNDLVWGSRERVSS